MFGGTTNVLGSKLGWADTGASTIGPSLPVVSTDDNFSIYSVAGLEAYYSTKDPADITTATGVQLWRDRSGKSNETLLACDGTAGATFTNGQAFGTGDFTIATKVSLANFTGTICDTSSGTRVAFSVDANGPNLYNGASLFRPATVAMALNTSVLVGLIRQSGQLYSFVDGTVYGPVACSTNFSTAINQIGVAQGGGGPFSGTIQRPAIWNRALSSGEVAALYASGGVPVAGDYYGAGIGTAINAGSFVVGKRYRIASAGNTDFTLVGAANSNVGTEFIATGVGTGTGNATAIGLLAYWDFSTATRGAATVTDTSGNSCVLTASTGARISGARDLYQGTAASQLTNLPWSGTNYGWLPGVAGNYFSTPDSAAVSITGDIDIRFKVALTDWTPAAENFLCGKAAGAGTRSYFFEVLNATGKLNLAWTADGTTYIQKASTVAPTVADGATLWVRATLDVDNGAAGNDVKFYTSPDGVTWTQLGTTVTTAGTTSIFDSTAQLEFGSLSSGSLPVNGQLYYGELRNGIGGTVVATFNPAEAADGASSWVSSTGETWTVNTSGGLPATIVGRAGVLADGVNDYLRTAPWNLVQPEWVVYVGRQISWTSNETIFAGNVNGENMNLFQTNGGASPQVSINAGSSVGPSSDWTMGTNAIISAVFNGASSQFRINRGTPITGNAGAYNANGFMLAAVSTPTSYGNILANEIAIFSRAPSTAEIDRVVRYMARKWQIAT